MLARKEKKQLYRYLLRSNLRCVSLGCCGGKMTQVAYGCYEEEDEGWTDRVIEVVYRF